MVSKDKTGAGNAPKRVTPPRHPSTGEFIKPNIIVPNYKPPKKTGKK
jgi:hypothetical protein